MKKSRLQELAGLMAEAQVHELDAAVKDKVAYKEFINAMDVLLPDWYAAGFTKQDVVDYMNRILPAPTNNNDIPGFEGTRDALANL